MLAVSQAVPPLYLFAFAFAFAFVFYVIFDVGLLFSVFFHAHVNVQSVTHKVCASMLAIRLNFPNSKCKHLAIKIACSNHHTFCGK